KWLPHLEVDRRHSKQAASARRSVVVRQLRVEKAIPLPGKWQLEERHTFFGLSTRLQRLRTALTLRVRPICRQKSPPHGVSSPIDYSSVRQSCYKIVLPRADRISSTPSSAVLLFMSRAVFISTTSSERMPPASAIFSMARCASRYVRPPRTRVPEPGASPGSSASTSKVTA